MKPCHVIGILLVSLIAYHTLLNKSAGASLHAKLKKEQLIIPLTVQDNGTYVRTLLFGVDPQATYCLDLYLGEFELPPMPPPGYFEARFTSIGGDCSGVGSYIDLRSYSSSAQVDTYQLSFQPGRGGYPVKFSWRRLDSLYRGSVHLMDVFGGTAVNIDMKAETSYVLYNVSINSLLIIAEGPIANALLIPYGYASTSLKATNYAILYGIVNANGFPAKGWFEYGTTISYGNSTAIRSVPADTPFVSISEEVYGLVPSTLYHFREVAFNANGTFYGPDLTFMTLPEGSAPIAVTKPATNITATSATLNAIVESDSSHAMVFFEWGTTQYYGNVTPETLLVDTGALALSSNLTGLTFGTSYHFRVVATNDRGTSIGLDYTFTTPVPLGVPIVTTDLATNISATSATLNATVRSNPPSVSVYFEWGMSVLYGHSTSPTILLAPNPVVIPYDLLSLSSDTTYHYRAVASNDIGTTYGKDQIFLTNKSYNLFDYFKNIRIPLTVQDNSGGFSTITFGVHPLATYCMDPDLNEYSLPPSPPAGNFDVRFIDVRYNSAACLGQGVNQDLYHYYSNTQIDTYFVAFQTGANGLPMTFSWQNLNPYYGGQVVMIYHESNELPTVIDMKSTNTAMINSSSIHDVIIIAEGPLIRMPSPPDSAYLGAHIISVRDVPNDQGGRVKLEWEASPLDYNVYSLPYYSIWRSVPDNSRLSRLQLLNPDKIRSTRILGMDYMWEWVAFSVARRMLKYSYIVHTLYDSCDQTDGKQYYLVTAQTNNLNVFYDSNVDSGYSVDNIAPEATQHTEIALRGRAVTLQWSACSEFDLRNYVIFRSTAHSKSYNGITPLAFTRKTSFTDHGPFPAGTLYYQIRSQDIHGNLSLSGPDLLVNLNGLIQRGTGVPSSNELYQNYPNPFNPTTSILFDIHQDGFVTIRIFNTLGQEVATLVRNHLDDGFYRVPFDATGLQSGVYFCHLSLFDEETGATIFSRTRKLVFIK